MIILEKYKDTKGYIVRIYCDGCQKRISIVELPAQGYTDDKIFCLECKSKRQNKF